MLSHQITHTHTYIYNITYFFMCIYIYNIYIHTCVCIYVICIYSPLPPSWGPFFFGVFLWAGHGRVQENVEVLGPGDLVQLVDLRMTELNGEQGYILRLVPGHKEERVEVPRRRKGEAVSWGGSLLGAEEFADFFEVWPDFAKKWSLKLEVASGKIKFFMFFCWCN